MGILGLALFIDSDLFVKVKQDGMDGQLEYLVDLGNVLVGQCPEYTCLSAGMFTG